MPNVVMLGTLDTKGAESAFVRDRLLGGGVGVTVVDCGILGEPTIPADVSRNEVAEAAGSSIDDLAKADDRGTAVVAMAKGARRIVADLHGKGVIGGGISLGGTGGTSIAAEAFRSLPLGVPKLIVSTAASADTSAYVGETDLVLFPSVVDIAGVNCISARILSNAAAALAGMVLSEPPDIAAGRPLVAASMFGVTTPCVTEGRRLLDEAGYEVLTFHMTGSGGRTMEALAGEGMLAGLLDITTTELADELVGGVFSAGVGRLAASTPNATPRVVSPGGLDMVNFGPKESIPARFKNRNLYVHNASITLMRTNCEECGELGKRLARRVSSLEGPCTLLLPLLGISEIAVEGRVFHDADADEALFTAVREHLDRDRVKLVEMETYINDPRFAARAVAELQLLLDSTNKEQVHGENSTIRDS
ncbi:Tm-1-like ATP-binding domain-containing protein [Hoeflea prorocentri]|uniref:Tm-1-like ATP-binding domain-containing protein n=1 Tax=Hoeflea prorocentri TaxID=1922333 RepID=A0A9X3ZHJ1_9HYPH|nr:Tm-1-like ATP-binding domain-containing protein [Hoeflea prorocentri]MCY6381897.1 Tm-1-like ATP-binding domain-containing protein [Hoeflea prorocentri]MDA5399697.1 Tm-1-like ATP-binding domain-containing protein [Hoeflea prorocentri]